MQESLQHPEPSPAKSKPSVVTLVTAAVAFLAAAWTLWFLFQPLAVHRDTSSSQAALPKMTEAEQDYLKSIQVGNVTLSRAENFLHQEVTILNGEVLNVGSENVAAVRLTTVFSDDMNQVVLRETRGILGSQDSPVAAGQRRLFEISFDHVPNSWNMQQPVVSVAYVRLASR